MDIIYAKSVKKSELSPFLFESEEFKIVLGILGAAGHGLKVEKIILFFDKKKLTKFNLIFTIFNLCGYGSGIATYTSYSKLYT